MISFEIPFLKRSFFPVSRDFFAVTFPASGHFSALFSTTHKKIVPKIPVRYLALHCTFQANCPDSVNFLYCSGLVRSGANIAARFARISQRRYTDISGSYLMI